MEDTKGNSVSELQPGTVLNAGKYIIEKKIGEGGFGITYKAVQKGLNRDVCIKEYFLAGRCVRDTHARTAQVQGISEEKYEKYRQAFVKEAQTLASLRHPNIVEVIDIFDENYTSYMVMNFIEGRCLQNVVDTGGPLSYPDAVNYMAQITNAVGYIHRHNILHRDIKPENIMITADYKAILIDFGSAREFEQDKTQMHTSMLTHGYAPPEQYTANSRKGAYTDIYALGATLYFVLTGKAPLEAAARLTEELVEPKQLNPSIPAEGNRIIMKAMSLRKEDRYQLVQDFMNDLKNIRADSSTKGKNLTRRFSAKGLTLWTFIIMLALASLVTIAFLATRQNLATTEIGEINLHNFKEQYEKAIETFEIMNGNIISDKNGESGVQYWVQGAYNALQTIEENENDDKFRHLELPFVFEDKLQLYRNSLLESKTIIERDIHGELNRGIQNDFVDTMTLRLKTLESKLEQTYDGSVINDQ